MTLVTRGEPVRRLRNQALQLFRKQTPYSLQQAAQVPEDRARIADQGDDLVDRCVPGQCSEAVGYQRVQSTGLLAVVDRPLQPAPNRRLKPRVVGEAFAPFRGCEGEDEGLARDVQLAAVPSRAESVNCWAVSWRSLVRCQDRGSQGSRTLAGA